MILIVTRYEMQIIIQRSKGCTQRGFPMAEGDSRLAQVALWRPGATVEGARGLSWRYPP